MPRSHNSPLKRDRARPPHRSRGKPKQRPERKIVRSYQPARLSHHGKVVLQPLMHRALERNIGAAKHKRKKQSDEDEEQDDAPKPLRICVQGSYRHLRLLSWQLA